MGLACGLGGTAGGGRGGAAILCRASGRGELWRGALLRACFGLGMTAPFVLAAFFAKPFLGFMGRFRQYQGHVEKVMGVMLIVFAILIATNTVNVIAN